MISAQWPTAFTQSVVIGAYIKKARVRTRLKFDALSKVVFSNVPAGSLVVNERRQVVDSGDHWTVPFKVMLPYPVGDLR